MMNLPIDKVQVEVESLYRRHYGKLVSSLLARFNQMEIKTAEDLVQDSFTQALTKWKANGIPSNPLGWIYTVGRNNALNIIKREKPGISSFDHDIPDGDPSLIETALEDYQLRLLFACAHPNFSPKVQVIITLKYVVNIKIEAIAKIFAMSIDGVDKLLSRVRQKIKEEKILMREPGIDSLQNRISIVHKIIYLIFDEGYKSSSGKEILKKELCEEALLLNKALLGSKYANKDTAALHALMHFNASRFEARFDHNGDILDLEEQNRQL